MRRVNSIYMILGGILVITIGIFLILFYENSRSITSHNNNNFNIMMIGWGGVQRNHLWELLNEGKLRNLQRLIREGSYVDINIATGMTVSKPGWSKILTGYDAEITGIYNNKRYRPIPKGYTIFERLKNHFGNENITTLLIGAISHNLGIRGPHRICLNCKRHVQYFWWNENLSVVANQNEKKILREMEGEPYLNAYRSRAIDIYDTSLGEGDNVGKKILENLEKIKNDRFFLFVQFYDPDTAGHLYGENSKEYSDAIIFTDKWLGKILFKLEELEIYQNTLIYVVTNNGFDEDSREHWNAPDIWLVTNDKMVNKKDGEIKDIAATILKRFGVNLEQIKPRLQGTPLYATAEAVQQNELESIRIGYFHGGRTALMMRAYEKREFEKAGLAVEFYSRNLYDREYSLIPKSIKEFNFKGEGNVGKVTGVEFIDEMMDNKLDLAMVGESSFILSVYDGYPIIAIAELGHDVKNHSGHIFLMRKGLKVNGPKDYLGKILVSRRAGPGDSIFLKEFLRKEGVNIEKDILQLDALPLTLEEKMKLPKDKVIIVDNLFEDKMHQGIRNGIVDGGYFHLMSVIGMANEFDIIQPLQYWANPELSHALLVCRKEFLQANKARLIALLEVYIKRIQYEHSLSYEERTKYRPKGEQMAINFRGFNYPQYDIVPTVSTDLLYEAMGLLRKYNFIGGKKVKIEDFVDNSLVLKALENLGISEQDDYWQSEY